MINGNRPRISLEKSDLPDLSRLAGTLLSANRILHLHAAVIGVGALGSEVARLLALAGAHHILLIDPDRWEASNLTRSSLCGPSDIGRFKAESLAERLRAWAPGIAHVNAEIADTGWGLLHACNIFFTAVDRDSARLEAARISTRLGIPMCDGGLGGAHAESGRVTWFPGAPQSACFCCRLTAARRRELLLEWNSQPHPCAPVAGEPPRPSTPIVASLTAALQLDCGLRALENSSEAFSLDFRLGLEPLLHRFELVRSDACPFHSAVDQSLQPVAATFAESAPVRWEWPICTLARCLACGHEWPPFERAARLRARGACPACGDARVLALQAIREVTPDSPWAASRPEDIGLPADHRYTKWDLI